MDTISTTGRTVAEAFITALSDRGIRYVFANGGTDFAPIIEGLSALPEKGGRAPEFMVVPHENVAVAMASGYFEVSGDIAAVMVHVTVGTANALCGIMNAARENIPILLAAGRTPITETGHPASRNGNIHWGQESFDQGGMLREYVKWDYELRANQPVGTVVGRALDIAMSDPKGPVYLTLPREVLATAVDDAGPAPRQRALGNIPAAPSAAAIEQAADLIAGADNVLIVAGGTSRSAEAFAALSELAETHAIAVVEPLGGNIASTHSMSLGLPTQAMLEWADAILVLDAPVPWIPSTAAPTSDTKLIHIATDPLYARYPFRGFEIDLAIAGSTDAALPMLDDALKVKLKSKASSIDKRRGRIAEMREKMIEAKQARIEEVSKMHPIHPVWSAHCLNQVKNQDAIVVNELGVPGAYLETHQHACLLGSSGAGGLGRGLGASLGAKLAAPDRQVIAVMGDGSYMFGVPIAAHFVGRAQNLPTLNIVSNNSVWLAVRGAALSVYPEGKAAKANAMPITELTPSPDFEKAIETCGGIGERVEDPDKLIPALERGLKHVEDGTPVLLNVITQAARG